MMQFKKEVMTMGSMRMVIR